MQYKKKSNLHRRIARAVALRVFTASRVGETPFKPYNDQQSQFGASQRPVNLLSGSIRAGKSLPLAQRLRQDMEDYPGGRFALVRKTRATIKETTLRSFLVEACGCPNTDNPLMGDGFLTEWNKQELGGRAHNGSEIFCLGLDRRAGEQEPQKLGSYEFTEIFIDEASEINESDFNMLQGRRSYHVPHKDTGELSTPKTFLATNPATPEHWIYKRLIKPLLGGQSEADLDIVADEYCFVGFLRTKDNPHLIQAYLDELERFPKESNFYKRMVLGLWIAFLGRVFDCFDERLHAIDSVPPPTKRSYNFRSIDFGGQNPYSCSWYRYFAENDTLYHYRQVYWSGMSDSEFAEMIKANSSKYETIRYNVSDHATAARLELAKHGIKTMLALKDIRAGIDEVNKRLSNNKLFFVRNALVSRDPKLATTDSVAKRVRPQSTLEEIVGYEWGVTSAGIPTDEPVGRDNHGCDDLRYGCMSIKQARHMEKLARMGNIRGI